MIRTVGYDLGRGITAFSTLRGDDFSEYDPYSGFNACHYVGDSPDHVAASRRQLATELGIPESNIIIPRQTHSADVAVISEIPASPDLTDSVDAIVTGMKNVAVCVNTADCVPVLLSDNAAGIIAAVHSGWRGTVKRIVAQAVKTMASLGADPRRTRVAMGPSICAGCFEVGNEVAEEFNRTFGRDNNIVDRTSAKPHIDLSAAIRLTLEEAGVPGENISEPIFCSRCNPRDFFSARTLGIDSGRTLSLILQSDLLDRPVK